MHLCQNYNVVYLTNFLHYRMLLPLYRRGERLVFIKRSGNAVKYGIKSKCRNTILIFLIFSQFVQYSMLLFVCYHGNHYFYLETNNVLESQLLYLVRGKWLLHACISSYYYIVDYKCARVLYIFSICLIGFRVGVRA